MELKNRIFLCFLKNKIKGIMKSIGCFPIENVLSSVILRICNVFHDEIIKWWIVLDFNFFLNLIQA